MARKQTGFTPCLSSFFDSQNALQTHLHQTNYTMVLLLLWETFPYLSMSGKGVNSGVSENLTTADNFLCSFTATFTRAYWTTTPPTSGFCSRCEQAQWPFIPVQVVMSIYRIQQPLSPASHSASKPETWLQYLFIRHTSYTPLTPQV